MKSYRELNKIPQFNFQANRILTYGALACDIDDVKRYVPSIKNLKDWERTWLKLAQNAEQKKKHLHAAYYYRMAEFFLKPNDLQKEIVYQKCIDNFYLGFDLELKLCYRHLHIPFQRGLLNCIKFTPKHPKGTVLICGGYDSFIEEFVLQVHELAKQNYEVILFEGPGQGECLKQKLYFQYDFEKVASAVIDYFGLEKCAMVGISWGGYFALRSAAYEKRIVAAVAYDIMDNGFEVMTNVFPSPICKILRFAYGHQYKKFVNIFTSILRKKSILADWALSQGMYITGTQTVYEFYQNLSRHSLGEIYPLLTQDILLLAGEKDHYIPLNQYCRLKSAIHHAHSLTSRLFTQAEGGNSIAR